MQCVSSMSETLILSLYHGEDNAFLHVDSMANSASEVMNTIEYLAFAIDDFMA